MTNRFTRQDLIDRRLNRIKTTDEWINGRGGVWTQKLQCRACGSISMYQFSDCYTIDELCCCDCGLVGFMQSIDPRTKF